MLLVNAGVTQIGMIEHFTDEEVQTVIDINVTGAVRTVQSVVPVMREAKVRRNNYHFFRPRATRCMNGFQYIPQPNGQ